MTTKTYNQCDFLDITYGEDARNTGNNSDMFHFQLTTPGGQDMLLKMPDGAFKETSDISFTLVGGIEFTEFLMSMEALIKDETNAKKGQY